MLVTADHSRERETRTSERRALCLGGAMLKELSVGATAVTVSLVTVAFLWFCAWLYSKLQDRRKAREDREAEFEIRARDTLAGTKIYVHARKTDGKRTDLESAIIGALANKESLVYNTDYLSTSLQLGNYNGIPEDAVLLMVTVRSAERGGGKYYFLDLRVVGDGGRILAAHLFEKFSAFPRQAVDYPELAEQVLTFLVFCGRQVWGDGPSVKLPAVSNA